MARFTSKRSERLQRLGTLGCLLVLACAMIWVAWPSLAERNATVAAAVLQGLATVLLVGITYGYAQSTRALADHQGAVRARESWVVELGAIDRVLALLDPVVGESIDDLLNHFGSMTRYAIEPLTAEVLAQRLLPSDDGIDPMRNLRGTGHLLMVASKDMSDRLGVQVHALGRDLDALTDLLDQLRMAIELPILIRDTGNDPPFQTEDLWRRWQEHKTGPFRDSRTPETLRSALESGEFARGLEMRTKEIKASLKAALEAPPAPAT